MICCLLAGDLGKPLLETLIQVQKPESREHCWCLSPEAGEDWYASSVRWRGGIRPFSHYLFHVGLNRLVDAHSPWGRQSALFSSLCSSLPAAPSQTHPQMFNLLFAHPMAQSSWHRKLTHPGTMDRVILRVQDRHLGNVTLVLQQVGSGSINHSVVKILPDNSQTWEIFVILRMTS